MSLNCVLSDLDGTLIDTRDIRLASFIETLRYFRVSDVTEREIIPHIDESPLFVLKSFGINSIDIYWDRYAHNIPLQLKLFDPFLRTKIYTLKKSSVKFGIVTSLKKHMANTLIETACIADLVDILVSYGRIKKPSPYPLLKAIGQLEVCAEKTIYIGDRNLDIMAGRHAEILTGAVLWSGGKNAFKGCLPDYWFHSFDEVVECALQMD